MLPTKFQVNWLLGLGEDVKNRFSRCHHSGHLGFPISMILAIFDLQVTLMLPTRSLESIALSVQEKSEN